MGYLYSCAHFSDGDKQLALNSSVDSLIVSPEMNKFQVLRDLRENYPCSDCELSFYDGSASLL